MEPYIVPVTILSMICFSMYLILSERLSRQGQQVHADLLLQLGRQLERLEL